MRRRAKRSKSTNPALEMLERRQYLSVSPGDTEVTLTWQGRAYKAIPDSYLLSMPNADPAAESGKGTGGLEVPASWETFPLGLGWFELRTPGANVSDVEAWAASQGVVDIEPNQILVKQRYEFDSYQRSVFPNDDWFTQYQWGLHSTGDTPSITSPESGAAAKLGNAQNIFPRWPISSGRVDAYGNLLNDADIDAPEAWFKETGSRDVIVVVMDDGVDHTHPDLNRNMWFRDAIDPWRQFSDQGVDGLVTGLAGPGVIQVTLGPGVALNTIVEIHRDWQRVGAAHVIQSLGGGNYLAQVHAEQAPFGGPGNGPNSPQRGAQYFQFDVSAVESGLQATTRLHISRRAGNFGFNSAEWLVRQNPLQPETQYQYVDGGWGVPGLIATQPGDPDMRNRDWDNSWRGANDAHGTHVAGIIGATGSNNSGVTGVAWATSIYSANIFRFGNYQLSASEDNPLEDKFRWQGAGGVGAIAAMVDAVERIIDLKTNYGQNIAVVNMSFNTYNPSQAMYNSIQRLGAAGILVVTAAGNGYDPCLLDGVGDQYFGTPCDWQPVYPAVYTLPSGQGPALPNIINVTASTAVDRLARFANWGVGVDIAAPGENIWSTVPLSARRLEPGAEVLGTDVPIRYDSREPFEPPPAGGQNVPRMNAVPRFGGFTTQPQVVRPLMYRQVPQTMIEYDRVGAIGREGGFASMSGTSMSAGYVSGTAALVASFYYRRVGVLPEVSFLKGAILGGADVTPTLSYTQSSPGQPPFDYQMRNRVDNGVEGTPVAWTGMYIPASDPHVGTVHTIPGNLRLNANGALQWCIDRMPPLVFLESPSSYSRLEGDAGLTTFEFVLTLVPSKFGPRGVTTDVRVTYWTEEIPGQATAGVDFVNIRRGEATPIRIPAGTTAGTKFVFGLPIVIGDNVREPDEQFRIRFAAVQQPGIRPQAYVSPTANQITTVIRNDDPSNAQPAVRINETPIRVEMRAGAKATVVRVPVTLDRAATRSIRIPYQVTTNMPDGKQGLLDAPAVPGVDFVAQNGTLNIQRGQRGGTIAFRVLGGQGSGPSRDLVVRLIEQPSFGTLKLNPAARLPNNLFVSIQRTVVQPPPRPQPQARTVQVSGPAQPVLEGDVALFSFALDEPVAAGWAVTIIYRTENGSAVAGRDFTGGSGKLVLRAGQVSGQVAIRTLQDRVFEPNETFGLRIVSVTYRSLTTREQGVASIIGPSLVSAVIADRPRAGLATQRA